MTRDELKGCGRDWARDQLCSETPEDVKTRAGSAALDMAHGMRDAECEQHAEVMADHIYDGITEALQSHKYRPRIQPTTGKKKR